jgi:hypothetical protein
VKRKTGEIAEFDDEDEDCLTVVGVIGEMNSGWETRLTNLQLLLSVESYSASIRCLVTRLKYRRHARSD